MQRILNYELQEIIYDNNVHTIYLGQRHADHKKIVFKTIHNDHATIKEKIKLKHEYDILQEHQCQNVINAYDFIDTGRPGLILEYYKGTTLKKLIDSRALTLKELLKVAINLINVIGVIHSKKIIHKDINPTNILVDEKTLELKLIDFEFATHLVQEYKEILNTDMIEGALSYISPELTGRLNHPIDYRADYYSFGITLYEMFTGVLPFNSKEPIEMIYDHLARTPKPLHLINPEVPEVLSQIVLRLLEKTPDNRYKSSIGITTDLEECYKQLNEQENVLTFALGQKDIYEYLHLSTKLYGREQDSKILIDAFKQVSGGLSELVLVSGYSGIGKTSLIKELYKDITRKNGLFLSAKFDQYLKSLPYFPFTEIIKKAIDQLLTNNPEQSEAIKHNILNRIGKNVGFLSALVPSLELIMGKQPVIEETALKENAQQIPLLFCQLIEAFATREQPIVFFIDDWQWSDSASQNLLKCLILGKTLKYCLIIASYRDNEIQSDHLFYPILEMLKTQTAVREIKLKPLKVESIANLIKDSFNLSVNKAKPLAELVNEKTQGNPFFISHFLKYLYQSKLINFCYKKKKWTWDLKCINQQSLTSNVVDYLLEEINNIPKNIKIILKISSCISFEFDVRLLLSVSSLNPNEIQLALNEASNKNLIIAGEISLLQILTKQIGTIQEEIRCKFSHDKIHNVFYSLNSEEEKLNLHLKIGEILEKRVTANDDTNLLKVVNHFNQARSLITATKMKIKLANMNLRAGDFTQKSQEYTMAVNYLLNGIQYLDDLSWSSEPDLTFNLHYQLAYNYFLNGSLTETEDLITFIFTKALGPEQKVKLNKLSSIVYLNQAEYSKAINSSLKALELLGEPLPSQVSTFRLIKELLKIKFFLRKYSINQLSNLPKAIDRLLLNKLDALEMITTPALLINPKLLALVHLKIIELTLKQGNSAFVGGSYIIYGIILLGHGIITKRKNEDEAYAFGRLGINVLDQFGIKSFQSQFYIFYACFLHSRRNSFKTCNNYLEETYKYAYETGSLSDMAVAAHQMISVSLLAGGYLSEVSKKADKGLLIAKKTKNSDEYICMNLIKNFLLSLTERQEKTDWGFDGKNEEEILGMVISSQKTRSNFIYLLYKIYYLFIMGEYSQANQIGEALEVLYKKKLVAGMYLWVFYYFIYPLTLAASYDSSCKKNKKSSLKMIKRFLNALEHKYKSNPQNHKNKYYLVKAEYFRITNQGIISIEYYRKSINAAKKSGFIQEEAFAHELLGKFYLTLHDKDAAKTHLRMAYELYSSWGATSKLLQMEALHPYLQEYLHDKNDFKSDLAINQQNLDFSSFIKASQAITSEIHLNPLLTKLLKILVENAGAERGLILSLQNNDWIVKIESLKGNETAILTNEPIKNRIDLPLNLLNYVIKTKRALVLGDAKNSEYALRDAYIINNKIKSICIMPINYKKGFNNLLYLENNLSEDVFNEYKVTMLSILAKQAAISLENAKLYYDATHDQLTGLSSRSMLYETFDYCAARVLREGTFIAFIFLDLDNFKNVNDTLGHEVGDNLLIYFSNQIKNCLRKDSLGVRLGGDEFVIMLDGLKDVTEVDTVINRLYTLFKKPVELSGHTLTISTSMGVSLYPSDAKDIHNLLKLADIALYKAKESGKNNCQFYTPKK